ncbi:type IV toxin-antitoxin system AbiEi family antitoxin domain-containing protein [Microbacterium sp. CH12i]|uniref:type IV toxin-antitoxin system AbiEi family antitoxin domain-containing protein n=1 Tax=Microbacterium sp. CH12i TaxID=1479651 RepID=UPI0009DDDE74|nr:type IV toxin-antitoxin system AbiEi family antitoxin domain-containing protein [Microbacterium sp. CH12i]
MSFVSAAAVLRSLARMARTSELKRLGVTESELTRATRAGEVVRPRQGVYALADADEALVHAAEHGGALGCSEAGKLHGLWILEVPDVHHIWLGRAGTARSDCDKCRIHWDDGRIKVGTLPPVANVLLQIATCAGEETFFAALESSLRHQKLPPGDIAWLWAHLPVTLRWLVGFARADADSGLESLVRLRLHRLGISVRTQVHIRGVGEVDFVIGDRLIIEADGKENHDDAATSPDEPVLSSRRHKDLLRDARAAALGYETLRFDYAMIVHDWPTVEAAILAKLREIAPNLTGKPGRFGRAAAGHDQTRRSNDG